MSDNHPYHYTLENDFDDGSSRYTPLTHRQGSVGLGIYVATPVPIPYGPVMHGAVREVTLGNASDETGEEVGSDESWYTAEEQLEILDGHPQTPTKTSRWTTATQPTRSKPNLLAGQGRYWTCRAIREWSTDVGIELDLPLPELPIFRGADHTLVEQEIPEALDTAELKLRLELLAFQVDIQKELVSLLLEANN